MNPLKSTSILALLVFAGFETRGQDAGQSLPSVPWVTTRPASTQPKGGPPETMSAEAKAVMDKFCTAVREEKWEEALSYCTLRTNSRRCQYGSYENYIRECVPIAQLLAEKRYCFWTSRRASLGGEGDFYGCFLTLYKTPDGETVNWEWWIEKNLDGWRIGLPDVSVEKWCQEEIDRHKRLKEKAEAKWKALEPKLKGLRTQLIAMQEEYRLGQPMLFRLELVNEGEHELSYDHQQVAVNGSMIIKDESDRIIPYKAGPVQTAGMDRPIEPGTSKVLFASLDIAKQYTIEKPGRYRVQFSGGGLRIGDAIGLENGVARRRFPSNTVEIEVKP